MTHMTDLHESPLLHRGTELLRQMLTFLAAVNRKLLPGREAEVLKMRAWAYNSSKTLLFFSQPPQGTRASWVLTYKVPAGT